MSTVLRKADDKKGHIKLAYFNHRVILSDVKRPAMKLREIRISCPNLFLFQLFLPLVENDEITESMRVDADEDPVSEFVVHCRANFVLPPS